MSNDPPTPQPKYHPLFGQKRSASASSSASSAAPPANAPKRKNNTKAAVARDPKQGRIVFGQAGLVAGRTEAEKAVETQKGKKKGEKKAMGEEASRSGGSHAREDVEGSGALPAPRPSAPFETPEAAPSSTLHAPAKADSTASSAETDVDRTEAEDTEMEVDDAASNAALPAEPAPAPAVHEGVSQPPPAGTDTGNEPTLDDGGRPKRKRPPPGSFTIPALSPLKPARSPSPPAKKRSQAPQALTSDKDGDDVRVVSPKGKKSGRPPKARPPVATAAPSSDDDVKYISTTSRSASPKRPPPPSKPLHPMFAPKAQSKKPRPSPRPEPTRLFNFSAVPPTSASSSKRAPEPIVISDEDSPKKPRPPAPALALHPIFAPLSRPARALPSAKAWTTGKWREAKEASWPLREDMHVQPPPALNWPDAPPSRVFGSRDPRAFVGVPAPPTSMPFAIDLRPPSSARPHTPSPSFSSPSLLRSHPAIARLPLPPSSEAETYADRFRPTRADEVLGNEEQAQYLKQWMSGLALGGEGWAGVRDVRTERRTRKRGRPRKARANDDDKWIDDDDIEHFSDEASDADAGAPAEATLEDDSARRIEYTSNAILLAGPSGTGKTAALYACAAELGWDVFEVNPGVGKRSGKELLSLVGAVGGNHVLGPGRETREGRTRSVVSHAEEEAASGEGTRFRESVILLEECDVLFEEDKGFWNAVGTLVAESKRPVVLTCNDPSVLQLSSIPLQTTLTFRPPPTDLAVSYLHAIAPDISRSHLKRLYLALHEPDAQERLAQDRVYPVRGVPAEVGAAGSGGDLRRALMALQVGGAAEPAVSEELGAVASGVSEELETDASAALASLKARAAYWDALSFADACVYPGLARTVEALEPEHSAPSSNDIVGYAHLVKPYPGPPAAGLAQFGREQEMGDEIVCRARERLGGKHVGREVRVLELAADRTSSAQYIENSLSFFANLLPLSAPLLPHPSLFTDYAPWIRHMVLVDDLYAVAATAVAAAGGRATRTSAAARMGIYYRYIDEDERVLEGMRKSGWEGVQCELRMQAAGKGAEKVGERAVEGQSVMEENGASAPVEEQRSV